MCSSKTGQAAQIYEQKEVVALKELKNRLGFSQDLSKIIASSSGGSSDVSDSILYSALEEFLLRFLRSENFVVSEAVEKLRRRRGFEKILPSISITPNTTSILRSGCVNVLGRDSEGSPVLFLNLEDLRIPVMDPSEAQRLLIVLLEYMQSLCMIMKPMGLDVGESAVPSADTPISNVYRSHIHTNPTGVGPSRNQKLTLLVNKSGAPWETYFAVLRKITALSTILDKYYPCFVNRVLVLESDLRARESLEANLKLSLKDMNCMIHVLDASALKSFLPEEIIPESLGGRKLHTNDAVAFPESVLHHWEALTSTIRHKTKTTQGDYNSSVNLIEVAECLGSPSWPLYLPPLFAMSPNHFLVVRRSSEAYVGSYKANMQFGLYDISTAPPLNDSPTFTESSQEIRSTLYSIGAGHPPCSSYQSTNDSICSSVSEDNGCDGNYLNNRPDVKDPLEKGALPDEFIGARELERIRDDPAYALQALKCERNRRLVAEQRLYRAEAGVHHDPQYATPIERRLAELHQELNEFVSDLLSRAKAASKVQEPPSLVQLLDYTLTALEMIVDVPEEVPAASLMQPRQREARISGCCFLM